MKREKNNILTIQKEKRKQQKRKSRLNTQKNLTKPKEPILSIILAKIMEQQPKALT